MQVRILPCQPFTCRPPKRSGNQPVKLAPLGVSRFDSCPAHPNQSGVAHWWSTRLLSAEGRVRFLTPEPVRGERSSAAERQVVDLDDAGSTPAVRPNVHVVVVHRLTTRPCQGRDSGFDSRRPHQFCSDAPRRTPPLVAAGLEVRLLLGAPLPVVRDRAPMLHGASTVLGKDGPAGSTPTRSPS
jgi:hypothetical protein